MQGHSSVAVQPRSAPLIVLLLALALLSPCCGQESGPRPPGEPHKHSPASAVIPEPSGQLTGLVLSGFFWKEPLSSLTSGRPLLELREEDLQEARSLLLHHMGQLSPHGWFAGIPERTLLLPQDGVRLVYGGSMADEVGVRSLDGTQTKGFFQCGDLVTLLQGLEADMDRQGASGDDGQPN